MSSHSDHDPGLDALGAALRGGHSEPPAAFLGAVRRRHRRVVAVRAAGALFTTAVIAVIAFAIATPGMRRPSPNPRPIVVMNGPAPSIIPTAGSVRGFIDDPTLLDGAVPSGDPGGAIRAGDRPDSAAARFLVDFN